jgi:WD40 repeat protein
MWTIPGSRELWRHDGIRSTVVETNSDDEDREVPNVQDAGFSRDGKHLALRLRDKTVRAWEATSGREISEIDPLSFAGWVAPTDAGPFVFAAKAGGSVEVWGSGAAWASTPLPHPGEVTGFFASPSGAYLATVVGQEIRLWETGSARPVGSTKDEAYVQDLAFSPDGLHLAAVTWGPSAILMETRGAREVARLTHDANPDPKGNGVTRAEFSRDSKYVVTAGQDNTARVWEVPSGRELARMAHDGPVVLAAFSGDGRYVTTWSDDRRVRVWLWRDQDLVEKACDRLTRNLTKEEWEKQFGGRAYSKTCPSLP